MSSFIGHGLAALAIGKGLAEKTNFRHYWAWQCFLVLCAFAPDIDYALPFLDRLHNYNLRITHSIIFSLLLPVLGMFYLYLFDRKNVFWGGVQACLAGLSHLLLDFLVGSKETDPLFFPLIAKGFTSPWGILPSPGKLSISNYYFYRNAVIECGVLIPAFLMIFHSTSRLKLSKVSLILSLVCLPVFLILSIKLTR